MVVFSNNPSRANTAYELITIDSIRQHILDGNVYMVFDSSLNGKGVALDASYNCLLFSTGTCSHKVKCTLEHDQSINYRVYELDASLNVHGVNRIIPKNYNRNESDNCGAQFTKAIPAGGISQAQASGLLIRSKFSWAYTSGSGPQGRTVFGGGADEYSFITNPDKFYVLSVYNRGPGVCMLGVVFRLTECTV